VHGLLQVSHGGNAGMDGAKSVMHAAAVVRKERQNVPTLRCDTSLRHFQQLQAPTELDVQVGAYSVKSSTPAPQTQVITRTTS